MPNENSNYYTELTHNLKHAGFTVSTGENNLLPIELDGKPLCLATESGGVRWQDSDIGDDRRPALDSVTFSRTPILCICSIRRAATGKSWRSSLIFPLTNSVM